MKNILIAISLTLAFGTAQAKRHYEYTPLPTESYLVADADGKIITEQEADKVRPIASISKLMTTLLASEQDLEEQLDIPKHREVQSSIPYRVKTMARKDLIELALIKSDNLAAQVLCTNIPDCVDNMNLRAQQLGMTDTYYIEPTGLDKSNVSTAKDLLKLVMVSMLNPVLTELSSMAEATIPIDHGKIRIHNTNPLTSTLDVVLSKTGFTKPAGGCMVMAINTDEGKRIYILLGSKNTRTRVPDIKRLVAKA